MSILLLLAVQAAGQEITTFYPLPSKQQQQRELRKAQGLPPLPETAEASAAKQAKAEPPKPPEPIVVQSVTKVSPNANVVFTGEAEGPK